MAGLFREAAVAAKQTQWLGEIVLIAPLQFTYLAALAGMMAICLAAFLTWGSYTQRSTVSGQLAPSAGLLRIYTPQSGIVLEKWVTEGQSVQKGDVLFILSSERQSSSQNNTQAYISQQIESRKASLVQDLDKTQGLQTAEREALVKKIAGLRNEITQLASQIDSQQQRVQLAEEAQQRYAGLLQKNFVSREQMAQKQADLLDQRSRRQGQQRERAGLERELTGLQYELANLSVKQEKQSAEIAREINSVSQELSESEAKRRVVIHAPAAGAATAVSAEVGQAVDASKALLSLVPRDSVLQAQLYAPSKTVGFIKPGDPVRIRFQAFPYQKFGHAQGIVQAVSKTTLPASELAGLGNMPAFGNATPNEPLYRVTVALTRQTILAYGQPQNLQAGMLLDADILRDQRRLYEWVLEPLYSLTGKL